MNDETRDRVFEPFFTTKELGRGTGLGLATVKGIIEQSGGVVQVESSPLSGSVFSVYLPAEQDRAAVDVSKKSNRPATPRTGTVLVVEDEVSVRTLTTTLLGQLGYTVIESGSPTDR